MATSVALPFTRILVPLDGSEPSAKALSDGIALGRAGASLVLLSAVDIQAIVAETTTMMGANDPTPVIDDLVAQASEMLEAVRARAQAAGVDARVTVVRERPVTGILAAAQDFACDLIVMGTHGRSGIPRAFLGSTTEGVLRESATPVLVVRPDMPDLADGLFSRMLVAVDDSEPAEAAARLAARLKNRCGAEVVLCSAVDTQDVDGRLVEEMHARAHALLERVGANAALANVVSELAEGEPVEAIMRAATTRHADVIVIGSHGRRGLERLLLGSVAESVVRQSPMPVLVVRA